MYCTVHTSQSKYTFLQLQYNLLRPEQRTFGFNLTYVENCEEDEEGVNDEGRDVGKCSKCKRHDPLSPSVCLSLISDLSPLSLTGQVHAGNLTPIPIDRELLCTVRGVRGRDLD